MIILGVDPGGTTGMCLVDLDKTTGTVYVLEADQITLPDLNPIELSFWFPEFDRRTGEPIETVVIESIVKTGRLTDGKIDQIKAAERIKYETEIYQIPVVEVTPEERGRITLTEEETKEIRRFTGRKLPHAEDALRAARAFIHKIM